MAVASSKPSRLCQSTGIPAAASFKHTSPAGAAGASRGVYLEELALLMYDIDAAEAMNLDGGGSSTLVVNNVLINRPAGGMEEREVMSAIAIFSKP